MGNRRDKAHRCGAAMPWTADLGGFQRIGCLWCLCLLGAPAAFGQGSAPGAVQQRNVGAVRQFEARSANLPATAEVLGLSDDAAEPGEPPPGADAGPAIRIAHVEFTPSAVFSRAELDAFARSVTQKPATMGDLLNLTRRINAAYKARGYPTCTAVLPPQTVAGGTIRVQLIEARIGKIEVCNNRRISARFVQQGLSQKCGDIFNLQKLERDLLRFNRINRAALHAELRAGSEAGSTDVVLQIDEPKTNEVALIVDNAGRRNIGLVRGTAIYRACSLLRSSDILTLAGTFTEGSRTALASYEVPLNSRGTRASLTYSWGQTEVVNGDFRQIDVAGESQGVELLLSHPLWVDARSKLLGFGHFTFNESDTEISGMRLSNEEDFGGGLGVSFERSDAHGTWSTTHEIKGGSGGPSGNRGGYVKYVGALGRAERFGAHLGASLSGGWQLANREDLPVAEQLQLGGVATVRGYPEGAFLCDSGYFGRAELWWTLPQTAAPVFRQRVPVLPRVFAFLDHGGGRGSGVNRTMTSCGAGVDVNIADHIFAQCVYAQPLESAPFGEEPQHLLFRLECRLNW